MKVRIPYIEGVLHATHPGAWAETKEELQSVIERYGPIPQHFSQMVFGHIEVDVPDDATPEQVHAITREARRNAGVE